MRKIYIVPNLVTTGNMFCGFYSMVASIHKDFTLAAWAIVAAQVFASVGTGLTPKVEEPVCKLACCIPGVCECKPAADSSQPKPAPVAPTSQRSEIKFAPVLIATVPFVLPSIAETNRSVPCGQRSFKPHLPPPLRLHCSLLI